MALSRAGRFGLRLRALDLALFRVLRTRGHPAAAEAAIAGFSSLGEHSRLWLGCSAAGMVLDPRGGQVYRRLAMTVVLAEVTNATLKLLVRRPRPLLADWPPLVRTASPRSYPSAHAATSFAAARVLSAVHPPAAVYALAAAMALSRSYLGVHYPSDLVAGAVLGTALAEFTR